jgi:hypothetical protein
MKKSFWISMLFLATVGAAFAQDVAAVEEVIKEVTAPGIIPDIVRWVGDSYVAWTVKAAMSIIVIVQVLKTLLAAFGTSLKGRWVWAANATMGLLGAIAAVLADGKLDGGEELWSLVAGVVAIVAAGFGYKVLFSETARVARDNSIRG